MPGGVRSRLGAASAAEYVRLPGESYYDPLAYHVMN